MAADLKVFCANAVSFHGFLRLHTRSIAGNSTPADLNPLPPTPPGHPVRARRLQMLCIVLAISNVLLGFLSAFLLRKIDREYSALIDRSVPVLNEIRIVDKNASKLYEAVIAGLVTPDAAKCAKALARARHYLQRSPLHRNNVLAADFLRLRPDMAAELKNSGEAYEKAIADILPRVTPQNTADAEKDTLEHLEPIFYRYYGAVDKVSDYVEKRTEKLSDDYTGLTNHSSLLVLGIGGWPVVIVGLLVAVTLAVVAVMLVVFRTANVGDGP